MNDEQYLHHCHELLAEFAETLFRRTADLEETDPLRQLAGAFQNLSNGGGELYADGPVLVSRLFTTYPDFAPTFPRQLLWFFGGDCLHYMPDEEINTFQQLEEQRLQAAARGETLDLRSARAKLLKLQ